LAGSARRPCVMKRGRDSEVIGMEARIEMGGEDGDEMSGLDHEIKRLIGLLADGENQQDAQSAMFTLVGIGPAAFGRLTQTMYETADDRLRIRTIEILGLSCRCHPEAIAILVAAWGVLVESRARGVIERALFATLLILLARNGVSQPEPTHVGRKGVRRASSSRGRMAVAESALPPPAETAGS
jgi:hypothetical protein